MLRSFDIVLIVVMTAAATVTYTIKHQAENKLEEVRKLEAEIKLEEDTIDLLRADWALLTQPNRLEKLVTVYQQDLQLARTAPTQLARPEELPMLRADLPPPADVLEAMGMAQGKSAKKTPTVTAGKKPVKTDTGAKTASAKKSTKIVDADADDAGDDADNIATGSVAR
ncbi:hypothetical protein ADU59_23285 [Pararhizobium polonicum]|uniref:Cell division protein FtsL n=1 Tax=Pararhizobium polonicum TaxID=1612624 RepID=A0A1C7NVG1_9HYPH|nr:hypothetical protein [Pararhizobium polonicum]OBZ93017.1 hypothetical protein ADU59_23285 [Pararhizobium polonicum]